MTELFLDNMPAVLMPSSNFKLTSENHYFTKSSSYTFDVELPLRVERNHRIFGNIDRIDVSKSSRTFSARLVVDNVTLLIGTAKITSVTGSSVKVQLLGNSAAYNYGNKAEGLYIDRMDLGNWYFETWPDGSWFGYANSHDAGSRGWHYSTDGKIPMSVYNRAMYKGPEFGEERYTGDELFARYHNGELGWVAYPTYSENSDVRFNQVAYNTIDPTAEFFEFYPFLKTYEGIHDATHYEVDYLTAAFAVQPMMWKVAEIIAKRTGFTLEREDNALYTDELFRKIFIVSCSTSDKCNKCLPHWTVNEFWEQVENTFGLIVSVDYINHSMRLMRQKDLYALAQPVVLRNIVDEFDTTLEDDTKHGISVSSVGFADSDFNPEDYLDEEVLANARYMDFDSIDDMRDWANANIGILNSYKDTIFRCKKEREFIYSTNAFQDGAEGFIEVNMLRPRIPDSVYDESASTDPEKQESPEIDIELKIVPARYSIQQADLLNAHRSSGGPGIVMGVNDEPIGTFDVTMLQIPGPETPQKYGSTRPGQETEELKIDLQAIVEDQEDYEFTKESESDLMYMAIINSLEGDWDSYYAKFDFTKDTSFSYPHAIIRGRCYVSLKSQGATFKDAPYSLSLIPIKNQKNLAGAIIKDLTAIHTDVRHCFKFVADTVPDTGAIFNIRNRLFVCEKIEANIKLDGLDHLMTGYFYELKN